MTDRNQDAELVERLRERLGEDHRRDCEGRCHACSCGFDTATDALLIQAASRIEALIAERGGTCFECDAALIGPICPKCNPIAEREWRPDRDQIRKVLTFAIAEARLHDCDDGLIEEQTDAILKLMEGRDAV